MNKLFTLLWILGMSILSASTQAQGNTNAVPQNEIDSMFVGPLPGHMALQHRIARVYSVDCLDTFDLFTNATDTLSREYVTWKKGYNGKPYRAFTLDQTYSSGNWTNYGTSATLEHDNACVDSVIQGQSWSGSHWYTTVNDSTTATYDAMGQPLTTFQYLYDAGGTGLWYPGVNRVYHYTGGQVTSDDYTSWPYYSNTNPSYYVDSNYAYSSYANYCTAQLDSYITYKYSGNTPVPYMKEKYQYFPNGGAKYVTLNWNTTTSTFDSTTIYIKLEDRFGNDSIYLLSNYNTALMKFVTESHDIYLNTYDADNNLIRVVDMSNRQTSNADSVQPYTIKQYSNYKACSAGPNGVNEVAVGIAYRVYPNPGTGRFTVALSELNDEATLTVTNIMGQQIQQLKLEGAKSEINIDQPDGVYIITISTAQSSSMQKIVIQR